MSEQTVEVLVVESEKVARDALHNLAHDAIPGAIITETPTLQEWMHHRNGDRPDVIILDARLELIELAATVVPSAKIVALGLHDDPLYRRQALLSGAHAYVPREHAPEQLPDILSSVTALGTQT